MTRDELYRLVWSKPATRIVEEYGVKVSRLTDLCYSMNVPRPSAGHWQKLMHGKASPTVALPALAPSADIAQSVSPTDQLGAKDQASRVNTLGETSEGKRAKSKKPKARQAKPKRHRIMAGAEELFAEGRLLDSGFLKPKKRKLPDILVSEKSLRIAIDTADALFNSFERAGYRVTIGSSDRYYGTREIDLREAPAKTPENHYPALWVPSRPTVVQIGNVEIGLVMYELTEEKEARYIDGKLIPLSELGSAKKSSHYGSWTTTRNYPTGRMCLMAYSSYYPGDWAIQWREVKPKDFRAQHEEIIRGIVDATATVDELTQKRRAKAEEHHLAWQEQHERYLLEYREQERKKRRSEARCTLESTIKQWNESQIAHNFFDEIEAIGASDDERRSELLSRLEEARRLFPKIDVVDAILAWLPPDED